MVDIPNMGGSVVVSVRIYRRILNDVYRDVYAIIL